jgi:hypothetical protein
MSDLETGMQTAADYGVISHGLRRPQIDNPFAGRLDAIACEPLAYAWDMGWREASFVAANKESK